jgi:hypothetical protein
MKDGSIEDGTGTPDGDVPDRTVELSLAMAQSTMQGAITASGLTWLEIARRFFVSPEGSDPWDGLGILTPDPSSGRQYGDRLSRMFEGDHDLTVREMGRLLGICGFEPRFDLAPVPGHRMGLPNLRRTTRRGWDSRGAGSRPTVGMVPPGYGCMSDPLDVPIGDAFIRLARVKNGLAAYGIHYLAELAMLTEGKVRRIADIGKKSRIEITYVLTSYGLHLGMSFPGWLPPSFTIKLKVGHDCVHRLPDKWVEVPGRSTEGMYTVQDLVWLTMGQEADPSRYMIDCSRANPDDISRRLTYGPPFRMDGDLPVVLSQNMIVRISGKEGSRT